MCGGNFISLFADVENLTSIDKIERLIVFSIDFAVKEGLSEKDAREIYSKLMRYFNQTHEYNQNWFVDAVVDQWAYPLTEISGED